MATEATSTPVIPSVEETDAQVTSCLLISLRVNLTMCLATGQESQSVCGCQKSSSFSRTLGQIQLYAD